MFKSSLVLVPALFCNYRLFEEQVKVLSSDYDVIIADNCSSSTMASLAGNILDKAPQEFYLGGISMGGYIALEIMRQAPERVKKLILMDTSARADTNDQVEKRIDAIATSEKGYFLEVVSNMFPKLLQVASFENEELIENLLLMAQEVGQEGFIHQQKAIMTRIDSRPFLDAIKCPTLVLGGKQDKASTPEIMQEIHLGIKKSEFIMIEDCGHLSPIEKPLAVTAAIGTFLKK
ncbi:MAG: alpha/beta fold hydrolase [Alphaproteobacteria bacterium]